MNPDNDALTAALSALDAIASPAPAAFRASGTAGAVEAPRIEFLGQKQGKVKSAQERMKAIPPADKKAYGQRFNAVKQALEGAWEAAKTRGERPAQARAGAGGVTLPGTRVKLGHTHPLTQTADELIDIFGRFGFAVARGPE